jgi:hypothetical protein
MPYGIDTTVDMVQSRPLKSSPDCTSPNTCSEQLMPSHHPVLCLRQLSKRPIHMAIDRVRGTSFTFGPYEGLNVKLDRETGSSRCLRRHLSQRLGRRNARVARETSNLSPKRACRGRVRCMAGEPPDQAGQGRREAE